MAMGWTCTHPPATVIGAGILTWQSLAFPRIVLSLSSGEGILIQWGWRDGDLGLQRLFSVTQRKPFSANENERGEKEKEESLWHQDPILSPNR